MGFTIVSQYNVLGFIYLFFVGYLKKFELLRLGCSSQYAIYTSHFLLITSESDIEISNFYNYQRP